MDRTGFSADQGSVFDTSLDTSGSMEVKGPALKYQRTAMCVISGMSSVAGGNTQREKFDESDNMSQSSGSTVARAAALEATIRAKEKKLAMLKFEVELEEDRVNLIKIHQESSSRSIASSRRSGRRPKSDRGAGAMPLLDEEFDVSRELSRLMEENEMFGESPIREIPQTQPKPDERAVAQENVSTTASTAIVNLEGIMTQACTTSGSNSQTMPNHDQPVASTSRVEFVTVAPGNPVSEIRIPAQRSSSPLVYGPDRGTVRRNSPFQRMPSQEPPRRQASRERSINKETMVEIRERANAEARDEAVSYLQEIHDKMQADHNVVLRGFEAEAERQHEMIMSSNANMMHAEHDELMKRKADSVEAERNRLRLIAQATIDQERTKVEQTAARRVAEFEGHMVAAQQDSERARHEAANLARERDAATAEAINSKRREEEAWVALQQREQEARAKERDIKAQAEATFREMNEKMQRLEREAAELRAKAEAKASMSAKEFFIGDTEAPTKSRRKARREDSSQSDQEKKVKIKVFKTPRSSARSDSQPSSSEEDRGRSKVPKVYTASRTATARTKTKVQGRHDPPPPEDGDGGHDDDEEDRPRRDKDRKPPRDPKRPSGSSGGGGFGGGGGGGGDSSPESSSDDDGDKSSDSDDQGITAEEKKSKKLLKKLIHGRSTGKEADKVVLPSVSDAAALRAWRVTARTNVVAASGQGERAFLWFCEIEQAGTTLKSLYRTGSRFRSLDAKLLSGVTDKAHGELGREITQHIEDYAKRGTMFRGRQAVFFSFTSFSRSLNRLEHCMTSPTS